MLGARCSVLGVLGAGSYNESLQQLHLCDVALKPATPNSATGVAGSVGTRTELSLAHRSSTMSCVASRGRAVSPRRGLPPSSAMQMQRAATKQAHPALDRFPIRTIKRLTSSHFTQVQSARAQAPAYILARTKPAP